MRLDTNNKNLLNNQNYLLWKKEKKKTIDYIENNEVFSRLDSSSYTHRKYKMIFRKIYINTVSIALMILLILGIIIPHPFIWFKLFSLISMLLILFKLFYKKKYLILKTPEKIHFYKK